MQFSSIFSFGILAAGVTARLHYQGFCVKNRSESPVGGSGWSVSYTWSKNYEIMPDATKCACNFYKNRNTGNEKWDQCPDCTFDGLSCNSAAQHIGGDELEYYCSNKCGAEGSEAD
ncbi:hypothetical protein CORC01_05361 [Colletotrichum orchidophilum]|uniref:Uncharacterized protein n=1 Tax=Colletotrichum orchidophilum TaxID=1209926 RepID=A0A1G4BD72_9PEZI|nr:uncharacterized protein CORC01_05361 [Colletotrichum orchidophilum]OHE99320.1 hypothetical protein CORC01_05361 [Colletotrichum orchidophilum]